MEFDALRKTSGRILGVDFGEARTGISLSDTARLLASGIGCLPGGGLEKSAAAIVDAAHRHGATAIVLGLPVNMNGTEGPRAQRIKALSDLIEKEDPSLPVVLMDERMTTLSATRYLNETDTHGKKRKQVIDTLSAQIILQNALDRLARL